MLFEDIAGMKGGRVVVKDSRTRDEKTSHNYKGYVLEWDNENSNVRAVIKSPKGKIIYEYAKGAEPTFAGFQSKVEANISRTRDEKVVEDSKTGATIFECMECGKKFKKKLGPNTFEVQCPKCGGYDIDATFYDSKTRDSLQYIKVIPKDFHLVEVYGRYRIYSDGKVFKAVRKDSSVGIVGNSLSYVKERIDLHTTDSLYKGQKVTAIKSEEGLREGETYTVIRGEKPITQSSEAEVKTVYVLQDSSGNLVTVLGCEDLFYRTEDSADTFTKGEALKVKIGEIQKNMDAARKMGYDTAQYQKEIDKLQEDSDLIYPEDFKEYGWIIRQNGEKIIAKHPQYGLTYEGRPYEIIGKLSRWLTDYTIMKMNMIKGKDSFNPKTKDVDLDFQIRFVQSIAKNEYGKVISYEKAKEIYQDALSQGRDIYEALKFSLKNILGDSKTKDAFSTETYKGKRFSIIKRGETFEAHFVFNKEPIVVKAFTEKDVIDRAKAKIDQAIKASFGDKKTKDNKRKGVKIFADGETRGDITISNGSIIKAGKKVGRADQFLKHGYHPMIEVIINGKRVKELEIDTPNIVDKVFEIVKAYTKDSIIPEELFGEIIEEIERITNPDYTEYEGRDVRFDYGDNSVWIRSSGSVEGSPSSKVARIKQIVSKMTTDLKTKDATKEEVLQKATGMNAGQRQDFRNKIDILLDKAEKLRKAGKGNSPEYKKLQQEAMALMRG